MRWLPAVAMALLLAGCASPFRPSAEGRELDRPSVVLGPVPFDGAPLWLNGTLRVSPLPPQAGAAATPGTPHNCFLVRSTDDEARSFLGGVLVALAWTPASAATAELNVTVAEPFAQHSWTAQGPSPLVLAAEDTDERPVRTPFAVQVEAAGGVPLPEQEAAFAVMVGVLESDLKGLAWEPCGVLEQPA